MKFLLVLAAMFAISPAYADNERGYILTWSGRTPDGYCKAFPLEPNNHFAKGVSFAHEVIEKEFRLKRGPWVNLNCENGGQGFVNELFSATPQEAKLVKEYFERNCFEREGYQSMCFRVQPVNYLQVDQWISMANPERTRRVPIQPVITWRKSMSFNWNLSQAFADSLDHQCYEQLVERISYRFSREQGRSLARLLRTGYNEPFLDFHVYAVTPGGKILVGDNGWVFAAKKWCNAR